MKTEAAKEAEKRREEDAKAHARFQSCNPFRFFPQYCCMDPTFRHDPFAVVALMDSRRKLERKDKATRFVTEAAADSLAEGIYAELDDICSRLNNIRREMLTGVKRCSCQATPN